MSSSCEAKSTPRSEAGDAGDTTVLGVEEFQLLPGEQQVGWIIILKRPEQLFFRARRYSGCWGCSPPSRGR